MSPFITRRCTIDDPISKRVVEEIGDFYLRTDDYNELSVNGKPGEVLCRAIRESNGNAWVTFSRDTEEILAIYGWSTEHWVPGRVIWMVGTDVLNNYKIPFYRVSKKILDNWLDKAGILHNFIDTRNELHMRWLKRLGFQFPEGLTADINGVAFQYFYKEK